MLIAWQRTPNGLAHSSGPAINFLPHCSVENPGFHAEEFGQAQLCTGRSGETPGGTQGQSRGALRLPVCRMGTRLLTVPLRGKGCRTTERSRRQERFGRQHRRRARPIIAPGCGICCGPSFPHALFALRKPVRTCARRPCTVHSPDSRTWVQAHPGHSRLSLQPKASSSLDFFCHICSPLSTPLRGTPPQLLSGAVRSDTVALNSRGRGVIPS